MGSFKKSASQKGGFYIEGVTNKDKLYRCDQNNSSFRKCTRWLSHCGTLDNHA